MAASSKKFDTQGIKRGQPKVAEPESCGTNEVYGPSQIPFAAKYLPRDSKRKHNTENRTIFNHELSGTKFMRTLVKTRSITDFQFGEKGFAPTTQSKVISELLEGAPKERSLAPAGGSLPHYSCHMRGRFSESNETNLHLNTFTFSTESFCDGGSSVLSECLKKDNHELDQNNPIDSPNSNHSHCLRQGLSYFETKNSPTCKLHPVVTQDSGYISLSDTGHSVRGCESTLLNDTFLEDMGIPQDLNKLSCELYEIKNASQKTSEVSNVYWSDSNNLIQDKNFENLIKFYPKKYVTGERAESSFEERHSLDVQYSIMADEDGDRALHIATVHEDVLLVKRLCYLMKCVGASIDMFNYLHQTSLHLAVIVGNQHLVEILLEEGASPKLRDRHGNTSLHLAVKYNQLECLRVLLNNRSTRDILVSYDNDGYSALHIAVRNRAFAVIKSLVKANCDVDVQDGKSGKTPLFHAVMDDDKPIVQLLLKVGASPDAMDYSGISPLEAAVLSEKKDMTFLLESRKLSANYRTEQG
ncbi:uncharacterized protein LOC143233242 isoform X2 [Tachypleus tridentatus]